MAARRRTAEFRSSLGGSLQHQTSQGVNWLLAQLSSAKSARSRMRASTRCSISDTRCWPSASKVATYSADLRQRIIDSGLQRGALAEVEGMHDQAGTGRTRVIGRPVARAVIDDDHFVACAVD